MRKQVEKPEIEEKAEEAKKAKKIVFEEIGSQPWGLKPEQLRWAATRVGSRGCTLFVNPDRLDYAKEVAAKVPGVEVDVDDRLSLEAWFVSKGDNAIGSEGI